MGIRLVVRPSGQSINGRGRIYIFIYKRNTPIVRSSDKTLSFLHLLTLLAMIGCDLYITADDDITIEKCVAQNLIPSILYTINVGFIYAKSQKLLTAYLSKVRVTRKQMQKAVGLQIFAIHKNICKHNHTFVFVSCSEF